MKTYKIAIIGNGPRGLSVLERLACKLASLTEKSCEIYYLDKSQLDTGRIWREDQSQSYIMNTVADEVSAFSGIGEIAQARPGAGPSLAIWWEHYYPPQSGPKAFQGKNSYAPRYLYGEYMKFVLASIKGHLHPNHRLIQQKREIVDIEHLAGKIDLLDSQHQTLSVDRVVIATGHSHNHLTDREKSYQQFATQHDGCTWIAGDSAADMPLNDIQPNQTVGVIGLGLSFLDVIAELTEGRDGKFIEDQHGCLTYVASGREPKIIAGSRSSLPIPGRGKNQKHQNHSYNPLFFTEEKIEQLTATGKISFETQIMPLVMAEVHLTYYATAIRNQYGSQGEQEFCEVVARLSHEPLPDIPQIAKTFGVSLPPINLESLAKPFENQYFKSLDNFRSVLCEALENDYHHACHGNVDDPLKAALDTLRDLRPQVRSVVDFGQLTPQSYEEDFLQKYSPISMLLSAGPPRFRTKQILALINKNILTIIGPDIQIDMDTENSLFCLYSPKVENSQKYISTLIDARVPNHNFHQDTSILMNRLKEKKILSSFVIKDSFREYITDGISITKAPYHPINAEGSICSNLYLLGIPCEHTRWFMSAGSSRPGFWTDFMQDAEAIATHIITNMND